MEYCYEVNPEQDLAIGTELSFEDMDGELMGDFDFHDVDPMIPTGAKPGSLDKVKMLAARYAAGVPLWHDSDCYDHGPVGSSLTGEGDEESYADEEEEEEDF